MPQSLKTALDFLLDLRFNNNKAWFETYRTRYDASQRAVEEFLGDLIRRFTPVTDLGPTTPKECMFRLHRDLRFAHDKTPYKTHIGIVLGYGGRKATSRWYYLHIEPNDSSAISTGLYDSTPEQLLAVREAIAENPVQIRDILDAPDFKKWTNGLEGETLTQPPRGFSEDNPAIELIKHKQFLASHRLSDADIVSADLADTIIEACLAMKPLAEYLASIK